jgi:hypothetical protein
VRRNRSLRAGPAGRVARWRLSRRTRCSKR